MQIEAFLTAAVINLKRLAMTVIVAIFAASAAPPNTGHRHPNNRLTARPAPLRASQQ